MGRMEMQHGGEDNIHMQPLKQFRDTIPPGEVPTSAEEMEMTSAPEVEAFVADLNTTRSCENLCIEPGLGANKDDGIYEGKVTLSSSKPREKACMGASGKISTGNRLPVIDENVNERDVVCHAKVDKNDERIIYGEDSSYRNKPYSYLSYDDSAGILVCAVHSIGITSRGALKGHIRRFHTDTVPFEIQKVRWHVYTSKQAENIRNHPLYPPEDGVRVGVSESRTSGPYQVGNTPKGYSSIEAKKTIDLKNIPVCLGGNLVTRSHIVYQNAPQTMKDSSISRLPYIKGLPVLSGFECSSCKRCFQEAVALKNHLIHFHKTTPDEAGARCRTGPKILMQSISNGRFLRFFQVSVPLDHLNRVVKPQGSYTQQITLEDHREDDSRTAMHDETVSDPMKRLHAFNKERINGSHQLHAHCTTLNMLHPSGHHCRSQAGLRVGEQPRLENVLEGEKHSQIFSSPCEDMLDSTSFKNETPLFIKQIAYNLTLYEIGIRDLHQVPVHLVRSSLPGDAAECQNGEDHDAQEKGSCAKLPDDQYCRYVSSHIARYLRKVYFLYSRSPQFIKNLVAPSQCERSFRRFTPTIRKESIRKYSNLICNLVLMSIRVFCSDLNSGKDSAAISSLRKFLPESLRRASEEYHKSWMICVSNEAMYRKQATTSCEDSRKGLEKMLAEERMEDVIQWNSLDFFLHKLLREILLFQVESTSSKPFIVRYFTAICSVRGGRKNDKSFTKESFRFLQAHEMSSDIAVLIYAASSCGIVELSDIDVKLSTLSRAEPWALIISESRYSTLVDLSGGDIDSVSTDRNVDDNLQPDSPSDIQPVFRTSCDIAENMRSMSTEAVRESFNCKKNIAVSYLRSELDIMLSHCHNDESRERYADCLNPKHNHLLCGTVDGVEISLNDVGKAIAQWRTEAANLIESDLLCGMKLPDGINNHLEQLNDDFLNSKNGFNFTCTTMNRPHVLKWISSLLRHLWSSETHRALWFLAPDQDPTGKEDNQNTAICNISEAKAKQWLHHAQLLQRVLLVLAHVTGGAPARGTEIAAYLNHNTSHSARSFYVLQGYVNLVSRYNKSQALTQKSRPIARMLPISVSRLFLVYNIFIKQFEVFLVEKLYCQSLAKSHAMYLFVEAGKPYDGEKVCNIISAEFRNQGLSIGFSQYRHFQTAITRRCLNENNVAFLDVLTRASLSSSPDSKVTMRDEILASKSVRSGKTSRALFEQAGHSVQTAEHHYAIGDHMLAGSSPTEFDQFREASKAMHNLLEFAYPGCIGISGSFLRPPVLSDAVDLYGLNQRKFIYGNGQEQGRSSSQAKESNPMFPPQEETSHGLHEHVLPSEKKQKLRHGAEDGGPKQEYAIHPMKPTRKIKSSYSSVMKDLQYLLPSLREMFQDKRAMFRSEIQLQATRLALERREDLIVIMPTGAGKSLIFMLPAFVERGNMVTVVVTHLVSLAADLNKRCFEAGLCVSTWEQIQKRVREEKEKIFKRGHGIDVLIIPVENVSKEDFQLYMRGLCSAGMLGRIVIDEVHITGMSASYRPDMINVASAINFFGEPVQRILLSATIPPNWECAVSEVHGIKSFKTLRMPTARKNLAYIVEQLKPRPFVSLQDRYAIQVYDTIAQEYKSYMSRRTGNSPGTSFQAIIYVPFTAMVGKIATKLEQLFDGRDGITGGERSGSSKSSILLQYHSKLSDEEKKVAYERWMSSTLSTERKIIVMVSTSAFGTGLDAPHVRLVARIIGVYSLLDYIQESGRAGRDSLPAKCVLIYDSKSPFYLLQSVKAFKKSAEIPNDPRFSVFDQIALCREATNWMLSDQTCRRRSLFAVVDEEESPPCLMSSTDRDTWCDVCSNVLHKENTSAGNTRVLTSSKEVVEDTVATEEPALENLEVRHRSGPITGEVETATKSSDLSGPPLGNVSGTYLGSYVGNEEVYGSTRANFDNASNIRAAINESLARFRNVMSRLQNICVICFISRFDLHADSMSCLSELKGRCFRCFQYGHSRNACLLKGFPNGTISRLRQHGKSCYGCGLYALNGVLLHSGGKVADCPFSKAIEICFASWFHQDRRCAIMEHMNIPSNSILSSPKVCSEFYDDFYRWLTEQDSGSTNLNVMSVILFLYSMYSKLSKRT